MRGAGTAGEAKPAALVSGVLEQVLGDPVQLQQWTIAGLPPDPTSIESALITTNARRWPLLVDPQNQARRWILSMERGDNREPIIVDINARDAVRRVETAV